MKRQYNREFLEIYCSEKKIKYVPISKDIKINRDTEIKGKCLTESCENTFNKNFRYLIENGGPYCVICCKKNSDTKKQETCMKNHGVKRPLQSPAIMEKLKQTVTETYGEGITNIFQSSVIKEKIKKDNLDNHGVEFNSQREENKQKQKDTINSRSDEEKRDILQKSRSTSTIKFGEDHYAKTDESKQRSIRRNMEKFGVPNQLQHYSNLPEVKQKTQDTILEKYGVRHPMQNTTIADEASKKSLRYYDYTFPSGRIDRIQGYENFALDELVTIYQENDIITGKKDVHEIWYADYNGKKHRHYVDIFIPSKKLCIEVKSNWTAEKKKDNIFLKQNAGKELGYHYEIWIYDAKGNKGECYK